jgi:hypothetical protein
VGKLKVPGYSTYIHPLGKDHLLTMGIHLPEPDANGITDWSQQSLKLTLFDVSDFSNPKEKFVHKVGTLHGSSEATYEHKAFTFFEQRELLAIPYSDHNPSSSGSGYWSSFVSELRVFRVNTATGITPWGSLSMTDLYQKNNKTSWGYGYSNWVRRSIMATDTKNEDYVYAVSDAGIRVAGAMTLDKPIATAELVP